MTLCFCLFVALYSVVCLCARVFVLLFVDSYILCFSQLLLYAKDIFVFTIPVDSVVYHSV